MKTKIKRSKSFFGASPTEVKRMKNETLKDFGLKKYGKKGKKLF